MPELPEVETIVNQLRKKILNKTIEKIEIFDPIVDNKIKKILPTKVIDIKRRAKSIIIKTSSHNLLTELRMSGFFTYDKNSKFIVAKFHFKDFILTHNSIRKFGSIKLLTNDELKNKLSKLGLEPLNLTLTKFQELLKSKPNLIIKTALMDPKFIVGIGNIYAQEILYHARINPKRQIKSLSIKEQKDIFYHMQFILNKAIENKGTTIHSYTHAQGSGNYQKYLKIYKKQFCPKNHKTKIIQLNQRTTTYCPICQL